MRAVLLATCCALASPPETEETRSWTDSTGKFTVQAEFIGAVQDQIRLRKTSGEIIVLSIEKLSEGDRQWIRARARASRSVPEDAARETGAFLKDCARNARDNPYLADCLLCLLESKLTQAQVEGGKDAHRSELSALIEAGEAQRLKLIGEEEAWIRSDRCGVPAKAQARQKVAKLRACQGIYLPTLYRLRPGDVGRLYLQTDPAVHGPASHALEVLQVVGAEKVLVSRWGSSETFFLARFSTEGLTDGKFIRPNCLVKVLGTETYTTLIGGSKTVFVAEPFGVDPALFIEMGRQIRDRR